MGTKLKNIVKFGINALSNIINGSANAIFALILPPLLLEQLSLSEYSLWSYCLQTGALIGYLNLGVQTAVGRYVALYKANNDFDNISKVINTSNKILYIMFVIGVLTSLTLGYQIENLITIDELSVKEHAPFIIAIVSLGYAVSLLNNSYLGYFIGVRENHIPMWINVFSKIILGLAIIFVARNGIVVMSIIFLIINIITTCFIIIYWKVKTKSKENNKVEYKDKKLFIKFCLGLSVWNIGMLLVSGMNTSIVGFYSFHDVAYFTIANGVVMALIGVVSTGLNPLIQIFTSLHADKEKEKLARIVIMLTNILAAFMLVSFSVYFALKDVLLDFWLQKEYISPVAGFINLLIVSACIRVLNIPYALALIATGNQSRALLGALIEGGVNITLAILMCTAFGVRYIAVAMIVSSIVGFLYNVIVNMKITKNDIPIIKRKLLSVEMFCLSSGVTLSFYNHMVASVICVILILYLIYCYMPILLGHRSV